MEKGSHLLVVDYLCLMEQGWMVERCFCFLYLLRLEMWPLRMHLFPHEKETLNQSVGKTLVVVVVVEYNGGSLVLLQEDHE